jgi:sec-independent protein translocase protein TatB
MFDIGFSELVVVGLIALIVLGPKRLPEVARTAGRWTGQLRRFIADVKQDLDREIHTEELSELRKLKVELENTRRLIGNASGDLVKGFAEINPDAATPTIHSPETPMLTDAASADVTATPATAGRKRAKPRSKPRLGKKHGGTRTARRR